MIHGSGQEDERRIAVEIYYMFGETMTATRYYIIIHCRFDYLNEPLDASGGLIIDIGLLPTENSFV